MPAPRKRTGRRKRRVLKRLTARSETKRKSTAKRKKGRRKAVKRAAAKSTRDKVAAHRRRLRAQGLRPIQIWVPDTRAPEFVAQAHRQSLLVASSPREAEDQAFLDALSDDT
jgi:hypothetical protein